MSTDLATRLGFHHLSTRDRRALRLGLIVALPVVLWAGAFRPWRRAWTETSDRLATERSLLVREQALLENATTLPDALREAGMQADLARRRMVEAPSAALAEGALTTELERLAADSRVLLDEMKSIEPPRSAPPAGLQPIRLAMRGQSDLNGFSAFLQRVEEDGMLMRVVELSIQPVMERPGNNNGRGRGQTQEPARPPQPTGVIEFAVMVEAYAAPDAFAGGAAPEEAGT